MYNSGDAAEQVVRMSLEGAEFALKITGSAAKNLAAALYTVLKDQKKTKGKARIETMLREKRPLKVYTIKKEDCPEFAKQAKGYGILYAPIPVKKGDDTIDILVFEDDAARANRIVEKFKLTVVDTASIKEDIEKSREERGGEPAAPEKAAPEKEPCDDDRPPMPDDADAPPAQDTPPVMESEAPVGFWSDLVAAVRKELKPPISGFFVVTPNAPVQGALVGDRLELRCSNGFTAQMLDRPEILEVVSRKAAAMLSRPVKAVTVDMSEKPAANPRMEQLMNFGRAHSDIVTIKR